MITKQGEEEIGIAIENNQYPTSYTIDLREFYFKFIINTNIGTTLIIPQFNPYR